MEKQLRNKTLTGFFVVGLLLIALLVFSNPILSSPIRQAEATGELIYTFDSVKSTYTVTGYTDSPVDIVIPATYDDGINGLHPVEGIGESAFKNCASLTSVVISSGITSIAKEAFYSCKSLNTVEIPGTVSVVGYESFKYCTALTSLTISSGVTKIDFGAFHTCANLTSVVIPGTVTSIESTAFSYCAKLASLTMEEGLVNIGSSAFYACGSLLSLTIPNTVQTLGSCAFLGGRKLTTITIPSSVTTMGGGVFGNCTALAEIIVEEGNEHFALKDGILYDKEFTVIKLCPGGLTLPTPFLIPSTVTNIEVFSFLGCSKLISIVIPNTVTVISTQAFRQCRNLTSLIFEENSPITFIGSYTFESCSSLTSIEIPDGVKIIDNNAFERCESLEYVTFGPNSQLQTIGGRAFYKCNNLKELKLPFLAEISGTKKNIADRAFESSPLLASLILENTVPPTLGNSTFLGSTIEDGDGKIYVPNASVTAYKEAAVWSNFASKIYRNPVEFVTFEERYGARFIGGVTFTHDVANGQITVNNLEDLEELNCTFLGWTGPGYAEPTKLIVIPDNIDESEARTYTACWDTVNYNITYELNGGTNNIGNKSTYAEKDLPMTLKAPTKEGYDFVGWYDNLSFEGNIVTTIPKGSTGDKTYYARWEIKKYTVKFLDYNSAQLKEETVNHGSFATAPENPSRTGYTFATWDKSFACVIENLDVFATYTANQYTITFNTNCDAVVGSITQGYETAIEKPENPKRTGYTFVNWYTDNGEFQNLFVFNTMPLNGAILYAKWNPNTDTKYTIEYYKQNINNDEYTLAETDDTNFGTTGETASIIDYEDKYTGFTFTEINSIIFGTIAGDGSLVLKAYYDRNKYKVNFVDFDNSPIIPEQEVKHGGNAIAPANNPARTGYEFVEWDTIFTNVIKVLRVKATYTANQYTITFNTNCDAVVNSITQGYETAIEKPENPKRTGYTFVDWYTDNGEFQNLFVFNTMPLNGAILYAKWTANTNTPYTIKYYKQDIESDQYTLVETDDTQTGTTGETANISNYENKYTGFTFTEINSVTFGTIAGDGSLILTAYYNRNQYTIMFYSNAGSQVDSIEKDYEAEVTKPENPTLQGYTFVDWYTDNGEFQNLFVFDTMPLNGAKLYAKWNAKTDTPYTIKYYQQNIGNDQYTVVETDNTKFGTTGETASLVDYVDKYIGFTFAEIDSIISGTIAGDGSLVLKAYYNRNNYIITFNSNGGSDVSQINKRYEAMVEAPAVPTKLGCTFDAWYTDNGDFLDKYTFSTMPLNGINLYANWNLIPYSIDYNLNGGNGDAAATNPTTYNVESENITLKHPKKAGYIFCGWTGTGVEEYTMGVIISKGNTGNRAYTAHWTPSTNTAYTIRYYQEKLGSTGYAFCEEETQYGTTDTNTTLTDHENKYPGFQYTATGSILSGTIAGDGTLTLKAYYDRKMYKATFTNENEQYEIQEIKYGGNIIKPTTTPTKVSDAKYTYTFKSWSPNVPETISSDIEFRATYVETINKYKVTFVDFDDSILKTQDVEYESSAVAPINPIRAGHAFKGWDTSFKTIVGAITVRATYTINRYTITFKKNGEETQIVVNYGDKITKPVDPQKTNCVFDGWYADVALTEKFDFNKVYNANKTIYGKWTCNVDVRLVIDDSPSEIKENIIVSKEGETWASLMAQYKDARTGYTLTSLSYKNLDNEVISEITEETVLDYNSRFEVIANYEANQYEVFLYLDSDAKEALTPITVSYDEKIEFLETPAREGYRFVGWYSNENDMFVQNGDVFTIPNDLALIARWEEESSNAQLMYIGIGIGVGLALIAGAIFIAAFVLKKKKIATQTNTPDDFLEGLPEKDDKE